MTILSVPIDVTVCGMNGQLANTVVTMRYDTAEPYAVRMRFPGTGPEWVFARDLLVVALSRDVECGIGDVVVRSRGTGVHITLRRPHGEAVTTFLRPDLDAFVDQACRLVPPGREHEHVDLDAALRALGVIA